MGKGSTPRPKSVQRTEYERRWEETFGTPEDPGGLLSLLDRQTALNEHRAVDLNRLERDLLAPETVVP